VVQALGVQVEEVVLIPPRTIPKTSSGKIQRRSCQALFLGGRLPKAEKLPLWKKILLLLHSAVGYLVFSARSQLRQPAPPRQEELGGSPRRDDAERWAAAHELLAASVTRITGRPVNRDLLAPDNTLEDLGLDSLGKIDLLLEIKRRLGGERVEQDLLQAGKVEAILRHVAESRHLAETEIRCSYAELFAPENPPARPSRLERWSSLLKKNLSRAFLSICGFLSRLVWHQEVEGTENLPEEGPFIICANHVSYLDAFWVVSRLPKGTFLRLHTFVSSVAFQDRGFLGRILGSIGTKLFGTVVGMIPVDRHGNVLPVLRAGAKFLQEGDVLLVYPEGRRSPTGQLLPFRPGVAILASLLGVPLVPVAVSGSYEVFPKHRSLPSLFDWTRRRRHRVSVKIGKPIVPSQQDPGKERTVIDLTAHLQREVQTLMTQRTD
jgi:long-chain acyl-CoA synthetase